MDKKNVTLEDVVLSNMFEIEAVIRLLEKRGLLTHTEVIDEIKIIKDEQSKQKDTNKG